MSETMIDLANFKGIFKGMLAEARSQGVARRLFGSLSDEDRAQALREVQRFFAPLAVAAQAMTSVEEVEQLREAMADIIADINKTASEIENDLAWAAGEVEEEDEEVKENQ